MSEEECDYGPPDCAYCKPQPSKWDRNPRLPGYGEPFVRQPTHPSPMVHAQGHDMNFPTNGTNVPPMQHSQQHERDLPPLPREREWAPSLIQTHGGYYHSRAAHSHPHSGSGGHPSNCSSSLSSMTQSSYSSASKLSGSLHSGGFSEQGTIRETVLPMPLLLNSKRYHPHEAPAGTPVVLKEERHSHFPTLRQAIPHAEGQQAEYGLATPLPFCSAEQLEPIKIISSHAFQRDHASRHARVHSTPESPSYDQLRFDKSEQPPLHPNKSAIQRTTSVPLAKIDLAKAALDSGLGADEPTPTQATFQRKKSDDSLVGFLADGKPKGSGRKQLFGEKGWLGRTPSMKEDPDDRFNKKQGLKSISSKIKQQVGDWAESKGKANDFDVLSKPTVAISLDPRSQAKLFSDLELMICESANIFLNNQYQAGRMSQASINKIMEKWTERNRPPVVDFQFDQGTQRDLVMYNMSTFAFGGEAAVSNIVLKATLQQWKAVAKEMGVRTFCTPDSAIRLLMLDIQKILEMLGAPAETLLTLQEMQMSTLSKIHQQFKSEIEAKVVRGSAILENMKREGLGTSKANSEAN